jgi:hypothetical protein
MRALIAAAILMLCPATALAQDYRLQSAAATELQGICNRDRGQLWGASLCGPLLVVDGRTRQAYATQRDGLGLLTLTGGGGWVGTLPPGVPIANTTVDWGGVRWIMVVGPLPEDATERRVLIAHEAWHRIQASINLPMQNVNATHLETERGRYLMRLELRALSTALLSSKRARQMAVRDALAFRLARLAAFPDAASQEASLDRNEGLAAYTGVKLGAGEEANLFAARTLESYDRHDAFARAYAYASGPAYGLLLDDYQPDWRATLGGYAPADLLVSRVRARALSTRNLQRRAERYGGPQIAAQERTRAETHRQLIATLRARFAAGPRLELPLGQMQFEFDPERVTPVEGLGSVYQTLVLRDRWGEFRANGGALIAPDFSRLVASAPDAGGRTGPGWTLTLAPGYRIAAPDPSGVLRPELIPPPPP